jgi:UbiA prenyltransferase family
MRRRADVGLGNVRISEDENRYHGADALSLELAGGNPSCVAQRGRTLAERSRGGGALNVAAKPILITGTLPLGAGKAQTLPAFSWLAAISDWALTKPEVNFLIAIATLTGFYLAFPGQLVPFPWLRLVHTLLGTLLVASGAGTLNQYIERRFDAQMRRTSRAPARGRPAETFGGFMFWDCAFFGGQHLSCDWCECAR